MRGRAARMQTSRSSAAASTQLRAKPQAPGLHHARTYTPQRPQQHQPDSAAAHRPSPRARTQTQHVPLPHPRRAAAPTTDSSRRMPEEKPTGKTFSLEECKQHITEKSCWLVIHGKVYDVTDFLEEHPGGYDIVVSSAGAYKVAPAAASPRSRPRQEPARRGSAGPHRARGRSAAARQGVDGPRCARVARVWPRPCIASSEAGRVAEISS